MYLLKSRVTLGVLVFTSTLACAWLFGDKLIGAGMFDFSEHIVNGYEYTFTGADSYINYQGHERPREIIVDTRVDGYLVVGNFVFVVRRPKEIYLDESKSHASRLLARCEYWVIDTIKHSVEITDRSKMFKNLTCKFDNHHSN